MLFASTGSAVAWPAANIVRGKDRRVNAGGTAVVWLRCNREWSRERIQPESPRSALQQDARRPCGKWCIGYGRQRGGSFGHAPARPDTRMSQSTFVEYGSNSA